MMRFKVTYEEQDAYGDWWTCWDDCNGHGFVHSDAEAVKRHLYDTRMGLVRNVQIVRM